MSARTHARPGLDHDDTLALLSRQTELLERIAEGTPLSDVLAGITAVLEDLVPGARCSVLLLDPVDPAPRGGAVAAARVLVPDRRPAHRRRRRVLRCGRVPGPAGRRRGHRDRPALARVPRDRDPARAAVVLVVADPGAPGCARDVRRLPRPPAPPLGP
ncbi:hypothetical protein Ae168Ps1_3813c [Pseudonocardia sp. Ae168_Ps1]|nr:hypothetical protein Ae150APs1_3790c [Pseudonocardia sp. Ae150A_Ps1]OLL81407.1 hypothetical protein Ae168Ps1_3813c [Pseudonocardia sp. Ae168_Ps1]OLL84478.1 hypothetical protein Ae263Ps1_1533 [Pseudonocardia sp. Ae263_Ps1]OLL95502.1 hypothetical protein Ae356Ps1_5399c [Pseudonocardia sp. Ae356_Ps1]